MVVSCSKNSWQYWRPLPDSAMTFLSQHIIFWYCNMKSQKPLITKNACKMKNIRSVCKKLQISINVYFFSNTFVKFICIFENGSLVSLFWEWPKYPSLQNILFQYFWISNIFKVLPLSSKYSNLFSMLYTVQANVIDILTFRICRAFSPIYPKKHLMLLWFAFIIFIFYLFKVSTITSKQSSVAQWLQVVVLL